MANLSSESLLSLSSWLAGAEDLSEESRLEKAKQIIADYEVDSTVQALITSTTSAAYNVALQFPDILLPHAPMICEALRLATEDTNRENELCTTFLFFILGDTSYGECCVDEVAAQHLNAEVVVHYGNACLSPTRSLPVLYVFPRLRFEQPQISVSVFKKSVAQLLLRDDVERLVLLYDADLFSCFQEGHFRANDISVPISYTQSQKTLSVASMRVGPVGTIVQPGVTASADDSYIQIGALKYSATSDIPMERTAFLWLTRESMLDEWPPAARNAALTLCTGPQQHCTGFFGASLTADTGEDPALVNASRILRKRFAVLSKAKDAERIGIVPGTLGVSGNLRVIERCKRVIKSVNKRSYVMLVGKPNPSKLANFAEIDVFVLVACPQNALLDGRDYLRPIITPLELEAALLAEGDIFSAPYSVDFQDLLKKELEIGKETASDDRVGSNESALTTRGDWSVSVTGSGAAADYLQSRHWQGLSYSSGGVDDETDIAEMPKQAVVGQTGIASKYDREFDRT